MRIVTLQLKTSPSFEKNFQRLESKINSTPKNSFLLAPELYLTGYSYNQLDEAVLFTQKSIKNLKNLSKNKTIAITMTTKKSNNFFNTLHIFHKG